MSSKRFSECHFKCVKVSLQQSFSVRSWWLNFLFSSFLFSSSASLFIFFFIPVPFGVFTACKVSACTSNKLFMVSITAPCTVFHLTSGHGKHFTASSAAQASLCARQKASISHITWCFHAPPRSLSRKCPSAFTAHHLGRTTYLWSGLKQKVKKEKPFGKKPNGVISLTRASCYFVVKCWRLFAHAEKTHPTGHCWWLYIYIYIYLSQSRCNHKALLLLSTHADRKSQASGDLTLKCVTYFPQWFLCVYRL